MRKSEKKLSFSFFVVDFFLFCYNETNFKKQQNIILQEYTYKDHQIKHHVVQHIHDLG